jgi:hypothetical protein
MAKQNFLANGLNSVWRRSPESFKTSGGRTATDRTDDLLSDTSDPSTKSTNFHFGTDWLQVTTTNIREDLFQLEIAVLPFCIDKILSCLVFRF